MTCEQLAGFKRGTMPPVSPEHVRLAEFGDLNHLRMADLDLYASRQTFAAAPCTRPGGVGDCLLIESTRGFEPAGSVARWTEAYIAVQWHDRSGAVQGKRWTSTSRETLALARGYFTACTCARDPVFQSYIVTGQEGHATLWLAGDRDKLEPTGDKATATRWRDYDDADAAADLWRTRWQIPTQVLPDTESAGLSMVVPAKRLRRVRGNSGYARFLANHIATEPIGMMLPLRGVPSPYASAPFWYVYRYTPAGGLPLDRVVIVETAHGVRDVFSVPEGVIRPVEKES